MLERMFWDVFQKTGSIEAYLASKECSHCGFNTEMSKELFPQIKNKRDEKSVKKDE